MICALRCVAENKASQWRNNKMSKAIYYICDVCGRESKSYFSSELMLHAESNWEEKKEESVILYRQKGPKFKSELTFCPDCKNQIEIMWKQIGEMFKDERLYHPRKCEYTGKMKVIEQLEVDRK